MSKAGVLIWLVIALALGAAAIWLLRTPPAAVAPARGPVMDVPMPRVTELVITPPGAPAQRVTRDSASGDWFLAGPGGDWPVQIANIQGALRLLSSLEGRNADLSAKAPGPGDAEVRLGLDDGTAWGLWLAERSLGGERLARILPPGGAPARTVLVDGAVFGALIGTGPAAWRVPLAMSELSADVSRITLSALKGRVVLGRIDGRWALQEPVAAPADDKAVQSLLKSLSSVHVARFLDAPPDPEVAQFGAPVATATLVSERRVPRGDGFEAVTTTRTLTVGGPASIDGKQLYARVGREVVRDGQAVGTPSEVMVCIGRESVEAVSMDAASYLAPAAAGSPAGEVGSVGISAGGRTLAYKRSVDGWEADPPPGQAGDNDRIELLLRLLCEQSAEVRVLRPQDPGLRSVAGVRLGSLGGSPLAEVSIGISETLGRAEGEPGPERLVVVSGDVVRVYDATPWRELLDWVGHSPSR